MKRTAPVWEKCDLSEMDCSLPDFVGACTYDGNEKHPPSLTLSPLKSYRAPIGKACLPITIFQGGAA